MIHTSLAYSIITMSSAHKACDDTGSSPLFAIYLVHKKQTDVFSNRHPKVAKKSRVSLMI